MKGVRIFMSIKIFGLMTFLAVFFILESSAFAVVSIGCG